MSPSRFLSFVFLILWASGLPAAPPPRDSGPPRFVAPPPRTPLYPEPAPAVDAQPVPESPAIAVPENKSETRTTRPEGASVQEEGTARSPARKAPVAATKPARKGPSKSGTNPKRTIPGRRSAPPSVPVLSGEKDTGRLDPAPAAMVVTKVDAFPEKRGLAARHYPASNENRIDLFRPYLTGLGGGYLGVGTDQNLTFIAWARSRYAWLMDFDPVSVGINRIHIYFLQRARTYADFRRLWSKRERGASLRLIQTRFRGDPDLKNLRRAFAVAHGRYSPVPTRLRELDAFTRRFQLSSFHNNPDDYAYLRDMALAGRIQAIPGDLRGGSTLKSINAAALQLGVPIRIVYTSNAEDYFKVFPFGFRANIIDIPGDARSVIVRTVSRRNYIYGQPPGEKFPKHAPFHYNVQTLDSLKAWFQLQHPLSITSIMDTRRPVRKGFSVVDTAPSKKPAGRRLTGAVPE